MTRQIQQLTALFNGNTVLTSSELVERLVAEGNTPENARQIIKRASTSKTL